MATAPKNPIKTGYTFLGWFLGENEYDFAAPVTTDITLVAKWEAKDVTIKFYKYGEGLSKEEMEDYTIVVKYYSMIPADKIPVIVVEDPAYISTGVWNKGSTNSSKPFDFATQAVDTIGSMSFYPAIVHKDSIAGVADTWIGTTEEGTYTVVIAYDEQGAKVDVSVTLKSTDGTVTNYVVKSVFCKSASTITIYVHYAAEDNATKYFTVKYDADNDTLSFSSPKVTFERQIAEA